MNPMVDCQNPSGVDCSIYPDCMEKSVACENTNCDYAIQYGYKFCNLYSDNYHWFSNRGKQWIDAVRKCLQVALVPYLSTNPSCCDFKTAAFNSHVECYTAPAKGISVCSLSPSDMLKIYWTIKSSFTLAFGENFTQVKATLAACSTIFYTELLITVSMTDSIDEDRQGGNIINTLIDDLQSAIISFIKSDIVLVYKHEEDWLKRGTLNSVIVAVFGNTADPADIKASIIYNAMISGQINITEGEISSVKLCNGTCYHSGVDRSTLMYFPLLIFVLLFNL